MFCCGLFLSDLLCVLVLFQLIVFYQVIFCVLKMSSSMSVSARESEDTALLLLKEIYDKLGIPFEQPQQY